jgi:hypothetical protein
MEWTSIGHGGLEGENENDVLNDVEARIVRKLPDDYN